MSLQLKVNGKKIDSLDPELITSNHATNLNGRNQTNQSMALQ